MVVKSKILKSFIAAFLILCSFSFFHSPSQKAQAFGECIFSPIVIYGKGTVPISISTAQDDEGGVRIQCGALRAAAGTWNGIKSTARLTNTTKEVANYVKKGGSSKAWSDFELMPGTPVYKGNGVYTKTVTEGNQSVTVTYYPKATSTNGPTLQFPSTSKGLVWDKIRYE